MSLEQEIEELTKAFKVRVCIVKIRTAFRIDIQRVKFDSSKPKFETVVSILNCTDLSAGIKSAHEELESKIRQFSKLDRQARAEKWQVNILPIGNN